MLKDDKKFNKTDLVNSIILSFFEKNNKEIQLIYKNYLSSNSKLFN